MANLKYYQDEHRELGLYRQAKITNQEAEHIFSVFQRRFKIPHSLRFYGYRDSGHCTRREVKLSNNPSILMMAHELAHAIQYRKRLKKFGIFKLPRMGWHTKQHAKLTRKLIGIIVEDLPAYKDAIAMKEGDRLASKATKAQRMAQIEAEKASPAYKLERLNGQKARWLTKKKRAENAIKKIERRIRIWEKKVSP
jgi:hypothetical protein